MSDFFELSAETRSDLGKGASRRLRRAGKVPAVIYGAGKDPQSVMFLHHKVMHSMEHEAFYSKILTVNVGGDAQKVVLKDVQRHPCKPVVFHMDFLRIDASEKLRMSVPLHFLGGEECPGVKIDSGIVSHQQTQVDIVCLPQDLPEYIEVDIANLQLDETVHLSSVKVPKGVEICELMGDTPNDLAIVSVHVPRAVSAEEEPTAEEGAEGEGGEAAEGGDETKGGEAEGGK